MSVPIRCATCNELIGTMPGGMLLLSANSRRITHRKVNCPGRENHPQPKRVEENKLYKKEHFVHYPETGTTSRWTEYRGFLGRIAQKINGSKLIIAIKNVRDGYILPPWWMPIAMFFIVFGILASTMALLYYLTKS